MTIPGMTRTISRRTALRYAVTTAGWASGLLLMPRQWTRPTPAVLSTVEQEAPPVPRFRFNCITPVPGFAPLGRLEEVWASPRYMTFTGCAVSYVGDGPFVLTAEESAVVDVVADAGGEVTDRRETYLLVLTASTRIEMSQLNDRLAELGRPIVRGSLALAPEAPQAKLFADWLASSP